MAEVAGLVLGGIPIAIWALEKYAEPFETHQNYYVAIQTLRADLTMQKSQLEITLRNIGLENPSVDELQECLGAKFPGIHQDLIVIIKAMDERTSKLLRDLDIDINGKPRWTGDPDRALWEWRRVKRSFASKKNRSLIDDLRKWNQDLRNCLERTEVSTEDDTRQVQALIRGFNPKHCDSIRSCLRSFHRALKSALQCNCPSSHQATIDLDWNLGPLRYQSAFSAGLSYETHPESEHSWRKFHVTPKGNTKTVTTSPARAKAKSSSPSSLLDMIYRLPYRTHSTTPQPVQDTTPPPPPPAQFIANLCGQVRTQCAPWCITGCLRDPEADKDQQFSHFSLNQHSEELSGLTRTISLRHLLLNQNRRQAHAHLALSAKQRYAIATSIAWSVLHLSDSPWLGEGWDQDEIKFFVDEGSEGMKLVSQFPSNSYAFHEPTTMDQPLSPSTKDFSRLIPNKTIFTLGVILIELCLKTPFEELRQTLHDESRGQAVSAPILDQYDTAIDRLDDVYREAGDSYGNAVQRCIKSSFQGPKSTRQFNVGQFRIQFYNTVVAPVQATYSMMP
ncbi:hypothetical protein NCS57_00184600 [Fusarium keratoplasticum]|uniref:Uncharacterized protein n=1 Tax=Fusarium keratoplasticum TaxID=1328300 RepID=A0ACC0RG90_9HYPO|nr:hypothetical protein NCS57_00184600 [Fusarium keratoplasticum]KAI8685161.1 hypothetical protein NCS57_00184600 [Fusarium keratoplasticum]KAI8689280.1 hypothetical protein NCS55_00184900 [Fusarium keratoplasticum]